MRRDGRGRGAQAGGRRHRAVLSLLLQREVLVGLHIPASIKQVLPTECGKEVLKIISAHLILTRQGSCPGLPLLQVPGDEDEFLRVKHRHVPPTAPDTLEHAGHKVRQDGGHLDQSEVSSVTCADQSQLT